MIAVSIVLGKILFGQFTVVKILDQRVMVEQMIEQPFEKKIGNIFIVE